MIHTTRKRTWTVDSLIKAIRTSTSTRQVLKKLGLKEAGGNYTQLAKYIKELNLDISHFTGPAWNKGTKGIPRKKIPLDQILKIGTYYQSHKLKKRLIEEKIKPAHCEDCGWSKTSPDGRLPLELEHINGNRHDNRLVNLKILCPNCHSMTNTYRRRK